MKIVMLKIDQLSSSDAGEMQENGRVLPFEV